MVDMKIRKALVLGSFWFCASFCIGAPVANTFLPVVPVPAEYSVGEGYFYFNADMKFGVENEVTYGIRLCNSIGAADRFYT